MADREIKAIVKINGKAGQANPAPPYGTALGPHGINIQQFCLQYNEATKDRMGEIVPVEIYIYEDRSFDFKLKTQPTAEFLKKAAGVEKGSGEPHKKKVGKVTKDQVKEIAEKKMVDLNAYDINQAVKIVEGTARSMGIKVE